MQPIPDFVQHLIAYAKLSHIGWVFVRTLVGKEYRFHSVTKIRLIFVEESVNILKWNYIQFNFKFMYICMQSVYCDC